MARKFFMDKFCLLTITALTLICFPGFAQAEKINIKALIDGRDQLIIRQNTLQWQHFECIAVGRFNGIFPTYISTSAMTSTAWYPVWPNDPDWPYNIDFGAYSSVYSNLNPPLPSGKAMHVTLTGVAVRGAAHIVQQPSGANNYTLKVEFDDNLLPGQAWYEIQLNITPVSHPAIPLLLD